MSDEQETTALARPSADMATAISEYKKLQEHLDSALPDCWMTIRGKRFRKKSYWRAVATAFRLDVAKIAEQRLDDGGVAYEVVYMATAPDGRSATGDGACSYSEKIVYQPNGKIDERKTRDNATLHKIRSHAHTRAYNRAVSNLVGFGEVSAEEVRFERDDPPPPQEAPRETVRQSQAEWGEGQRNKILALKGELGIGWDALCTKVLGYTIHQSEGVIPTRDQATQLQAWLEAEKAARQ